jgi:hypothetical protein
MRLVQAERDDTMMVSGYERQTLQCSACNETERRTVYTGHTSSPPTEPAPAAAASIAAIPDTDAPPVAAPIAATAEAAATDDATPLASMLSEADKDLDESEIMLRRAIEMVRGAVRGVGHKAPTGLTDSITARSSSSRVVRIRYDTSDDPPYVAADAQSGLVVLRHQDRARLRAMCSRLGWQVVDADADAPSTPA